MSKDLSLQIEETNLSIMDAIKLVIKKEKGVDYLSSEQEIDLENQINAMVRRTFRGSYSEALMTLSEKSDDGLEFVIINDKVYKINNFKLETKDDFKLDIKKEENESITINAVISDEHDFDIRDFIKKVQDVGNKMTDENVFESKKRKNIIYR